MKFGIVTTPAVTASVVIGMSAAIVFIVYASPKLGTPGILTIVVIALLAL